MGSLILCHKKKAKHPYEIARVHMHIYTIEELCYYFCNNLYLVDYTIVNRKLCDWLEEELELYEAVERLAPQVMAQRGQKKVLCANVDMFSGFVYKMMGIPEELYTPLFAMSRMTGWCAHRLEELFTPGARIIRPAYKAVAPSRPFIPLEKR